MFVLKFFKPLVTPLTNKVFLDPKGPLTKTLLSSQCYKHGEQYEVSKLYQKRVLHPLNQLTPAQQFEVGKKAAEHGVT